MNDILNALRKELTRAARNRMPEYDMNVRRIKSRMLLEICCRLPLALAIDEVTRADNYKASYLNELDRAWCVENLKEMFSSKKQFHGMGAYLTAATELLKRFDPVRRPASIRYIQDMARILNSEKLVKLRNWGSHGVETDAEIETLCQALMNMIDGERTNPYFNDRNVKLLVLQNADAERSEWDLDVLDNGEGGYQSVILQQRELLRGEPREGDMMTPIALSPNALYLQVRLPDGTERLHLISPLFVADMKDGYRYDFSIFYSRYDDELQSSLYLNVTAPVPTGIAQDSEKDHWLDKSVGYWLKTVEWNSDLFAGSGAGIFARNMGPYQFKYSMNLRRDARHATYPELWDVVFNNKEFFDVPMYTDEKLRDLRSMFRNPQPVSNPHYVCGRGGVGKTHTVIKALYDYIYADDVSAWKPFKYIIFLTAKKTMFKVEAANDESAFQHRESADFQTCIQALQKIVEFVSRNPEAKNSTDINFLIREIKAVPRNVPVMLIIDDFDSVRSYTEKETSEEQRKSNEEEQRKLARALQEIASDNMRIIVTSRNPLNQVGTELEPLSRANSDKFANAYCLRRYGDRNMPKGWAEMIYNVGQGVPVFIMRSIYLLKKNIWGELSEQEVRKLRSDIVNFSLNTTLLTQLGKEVFKSIVDLQMALQGIPTGLLYLLFYNEETEAIDDAIRSVMAWEMVTPNEGGNLILRDDSMMLWGEIKGDKILTPVHDCVLKAMMKDWKALGAYGFRSDLIRVMCGELEKSEVLFDQEERRQFALRFFALDRDKDAALYGLRMCSDYQEICNRIAGWKSASEAPAIAQAPSAAKKAALEMPAAAHDTEIVDAARIEEMIESVCRKWDRLTMLRLIDIFSETDFADEAMRRCCRTMLEKIPDKVLDAMDAGESIGDIDVSILNIRDRYVEITKDNSAYDLATNLY